MNQKQILVKIVNLSFVKVIRYYLKINNKQKDLIIKKAKINDNFYRLVPAIVVNNALTQSKVPKIM